jgi:hypothetical protein
MDLLPPLKRSWMGGGAGVVGTQTRLKSAGYVHRWQPQMFGVQRGVLRGRAQSSAPAVLHEASVPEGEQGGEPEAMDG